MAAAGADLLVEPHPMDDDLLPLNGTVASNPGRLRVNYLRWFLHKPAWPLGWAVALVAAVAAAVWLHWAFWFAAVVLLLCNVFYWFRLTMHFGRGDANPGLVVSAAPPLVAVATDLSKGFGVFPAVKVFAAGPLRVAGRRPEVGDRVGTVSLYTPGPDSSAPHWADFDPHPAEYVTADPAAIAGLMATFTPADWDNLARLMEQVPRPYRPGLYLLPADG
jgi:hypothetical protein